MNYFASGSGRNWKCTTIGLAPLPPSFNHGARSPLVVHRPRPFPSSLRIVDAPVETLRVKAHRVGHAQDDHLAVFHGDQAVVQVAGGHGHVFAKAEGVVLVDPGIVTRLGAIIAETFKARSGILIKRPTFGAMIAGRFWPVERAFAFPAIETTQVAARQGHPDDALRDRYRRRAAQNRALVRYKSR